MKKTFLYFILPVQLILIFFSAYVAWFFYKNNGVELKPESIRFMLFLFVAFIICLIQVLYFIWKTTYKTSMQLESISAIAKKFRDGSFAQRFSYSEDQTPEVLKLNKNLNNLVARVERRLVAMQQKIFEKDAVLASMSGAVVAIDLDENIYLINSAAKKLFNIKPDNHDTKTFAEVVRVPELYNTLVLSMKNGTSLDESFSVDGTMMGQSEKNMYIQVKSEPIIGRKNRKTGAVFVFNNMTNIKKLEKHRSNFVGNVSHELKTPLTLIQGFSETLMDSGTDLSPEDNKKYIGIIHKHSSRLGTLIDDLLSISKLENQEARPDNFEFGEVSLVVKSAMSLCKEKSQGKKIELSLSDKSDGFTLPMNFSLLEQAIVNLIDNSIKHSPEGSKVEINLNKSDKQLNIEVKDYGLGMEPKHLSHIFERFYRVDKGRSREEGGTGLGLSIVKHVTQLHGGSISVESKPGDGSSFKIEFRL